MTFLLDSLGVEIIRYDLMVLMVVGLGIAVAIVLILYEITRFGRRKEVNPD